MGTATLSVWGRALLRACPERSRRVHRPQGRCLSGNLIRTRGPALLLLANVLAGHLSESALRISPEMVVAIGLLAHYKSSAVIARVKPFRGRNLATAPAVEAHARAHLHERTTLRKFDRLLVLDAYPRRPQILPHPQRTHRHPISRPSFANRMPVARGKRHQAHQHHRRQHDRNQDADRFFQIQFASKPWTRTLWSKNPILSTFVDAKTAPTVVASHDIVVWQAGKVTPRLPVDSMETVHSTTVTSPAGPLFLAAS